jgi:predicted nucleic acid-binding protein
LTFVVDASLALKWCFPDEATPRSEGLLAELRRDEAHVSHVWPLEVTNILLAAERKNRYSRAEVSGMVSRLARLPLIVDDKGIDAVFTNTLSLAREQGLTTYDASYVELAIRLGLALASDDGDMRMAAANLGVQLR